jgi:hypothetical protein
MESLQNTEMPSFIIYHFELSHISDLAGVLVSNVSVIVLKESLEFISGVIDGYEYPDCDCD